jgi:Ca2+-binding EF-hand superfamily protein
MASQFQRAKLIGVFRAMDVDGDGYLVRGDFEALRDRWTGLRAVPAGSPDHQRLSAVMLGWWSALVGASDTDGDGRITLDEVLTLVDQLPGMSDAVAGTALAMFEAIDENADGEISAAEYHQLIEAWNGVGTDTDAVFHLLDRNGDDHLSRDEFVGLWTEFWAGDDPAAPGTWVFGRFDLPAPATN